MTKWNYPFKEVLYMYDLYDRMLFNRYEELLEWCMSPKEEECIEVEYTIYDEEKLLEVQDEQHNELE